MNAVLKAVPMKQYLLVGCGSERGKRIKFDGNDEHGPGSPEGSFDNGSLMTWDIDPDLKPDITHDLDVLPYPVPSNVYDEIHCYEVLEHCGTQGDGKFFFGQFAEFWRMLKPGGYLCISVPAWDSYMAWGVPDHKRVLPLNIFGFLDPRYYDNLGKPGYADYRKLLGKTNFRFVAADEKNPDQLYVVMRAIK